MAKILTGIQSTGTPHLGNILGAIIPAIKMANSSNEATIRVRILDQSELEGNIMREARRRAARAQRSDPNGDKTTQKQADFITRNIGRTKN